jgi:hypothetical protein
MDVSSGTETVMGTQTLADVLHDAGEIHGIVHKMVNGEDADWASWYADWLIDLSPLPDLLGVTPVRSELIYVLVDLDKDYTSTPREQSWEDFYAAGLTAHFSAKEAAR